MNTKQVPKDPDIPSDINNHLIGVWRFREVNKPVVWCATFCYKGHYYDVDGAITLSEVFNKIRTSLKKLKQGNKRG